MPGAPAGHAARPPHPHAKCANSVAHCGARRGLPVEGGALAALVLRPHVKQWRGTPVRCAARRAPSPPLPPLLPPRARAPATASHQDHANAPFGLLNCSTLPSFLKSCTVSMLGTALTASFFKPACSFFSSTAEALCDVFTGRRVVPFPPMCVSTLPKRALSFSRCRMGGKKGEGRGTVRGGGGEGKMGATGRVWARLIQTANKVTRTAARTSGGISIFCVLLARNPHRRRCW
jgi:hypothetical protein